MERGTDTKLLILEKAFTSMKSCTALNGYLISKSHQSQLRLQKNFVALENLTYGEISLKGFHSLLEDINEYLATAESFYDVGSGTGRAVFVASIAIASIKSCTGFEIVDKLSTASKALKYKLQNISKIQKEIRKCSFHCCDSFLQENMETWLRGDIIFLPTTCFTSEIMNRINVNLCQTKSGTIIICTTRSLRSTELTLIHDKRYAYFKGSLRFLVYKRK